VETAAYKAPDLLSTVDHLIFTFTQSINPRTPDGHSAWSMIALEYTRTNKFAACRRQAFTS
jgi:hypothetical protein